MPTLNFLPWNGCKSFGFYWQLHFYVWFICTTAHNVIYVKLFHFKHLAQEISRKADILLIWWKTPRISYRTFQIKTRASFKYRGFSGVKVNKSSPPSQYNKNFYWSHSCLYQHRRMFLWWMDINSSPHTCYRDLLL